MGTCRIYVIFGQTFKPLCIHDIHDIHVHVHVSVGIQPPLYTVHLTSLHVYYLLV